MTMATFYCRRFVTFCDMKKLKMTKMLGWCRSRCYIAYGRCSGIHTEIRRGGGKGDVFIYPEATRSVCCVSCKLIIKHLRILIAFYFYFSFTSPGFYSFTTAICLAK